MRAWLITVALPLILLVPGSVAEAPLEIDILEDFLAQFDIGPGLVHCARHDGTAFSPAGPVTVPGGATNDILLQHKQWHLEYEGRPGSQDDPSDANRFGDHFVFWHREFIGSYEEWRATNGHPPLPAWDSGTPIPAELSYEFPGRGCMPGRNPDPSVPLPSWATLEGGPASDPIFGATTLCEFKDINQFGKALAKEYHPAVHGAIGGDMSTGQGPRDPVFWAYHRFVDDRALEFESECLAEVAGGDVPASNAGRDTPALGIVASLACISIGCLMRRRR